MIVLMQGNISIMIKPASLNCNLRCDYCFYFDEAMKREFPDRGFMKEDTVRNLVSKSLMLGCSVSYMFQGGEPSLVGLDWFKRFIEIEEEYNTEGVEISHFFQTNGTNINKEWAVFFREHQFLVGVSYDGNNRVHDVHRRSAQGKKTGRDVSKALAILEENKVDYNVLTVVTNAVAENPELVFDGLMSKGIEYQQYLSCMDPLSTDKTFLDPHKYGVFLVTLFDQWVAALHQGYHVSIRLFDNFVSILCGYPPEACDMLGNCSIQYVVEGDGSMYPCDFYCMDEYCLGNINTDSFSDFDAKRRDIGFIERSLVKKDACIQCKYFNLCRGGCPRYRDAQTGMYHYCESYTYLFDHRLEQFQALAASLLKADKQNT